MVRPVICGCAGDNSVEVFRIALGFHERFAASVRTADEIIPGRVFSVESVEECLGLEACFMQGAVAEADQFLRMPDGKSSGAVRVWGVVPSIGSGSDESA